MLAIEARFKYARFFLSKKVCRKFYNINLIISCFSIFTVFNFHRSVEKSALPYKISLRLNRHLNCLMLRRFVIFI